ncbi:MAG TPA: cytochrome c [Gaiellaceae bacterium]|nr:cytochrome c [Gaiellaceae bacterium]
MATRVDERREEFKRYKEDVQSRGKPFFPYAMWHDTVMSLVVVSVIIVLACVWYFDSGEDPKDVGVLGPRYTAEADPGTVSFIPRPDWFFYFLFYLLRIFKWPESVVLGTVGVPTLCLILLLALPFLDVRRERRIIRRPVALVAGVLVIISMGVLTYKGATAEEAAAGADVVDQWMTEGQLPEEARQGAELVAESGCLNCHQYRGVGSPNLGAPDLTQIGQGGRGVDGFQRYVANPSEFGNNVMPHYESLGEENLHAIAVFLDASKNP